MKIRSKTLTADVLGEVLPQLKEIKFREIGQIPFYILQNLEVFLLKSKQINGIVNGSLVLLKLRLLSLGGNHLATLSDTFFNGMSAVEHVNFGGNHMTHIGRAFTSLRNIKTINLNNNKIPGINLKDFDRLSRLEELMLLNGGVFE